MFSLQRYARMRSIRLPLNGWCD